MLRSMTVAGLGGIAFLSMFAASALAETANFNNPMQGPNRLDWCFSWGEGCGEQAATAWCQAQGFSGGATAFNIANDIGATQPTRLLSTGAVCDQAFCDGFANITCTRPDPTQVFANPMHGPNRLDYCFSWGEGCGQQAATAWCQAKGFAGGAVAFNVAADIGASQPTRLISTGAVCDQAFCDGFQSITCKH
ncbi:MAG: hypothetical protein GY798_01650 [Hyphomicrobiales bacterium]|nr:hypothetical protein [Hyphomicrobiales bacterium]